MYSHQTNLIVIIILEKTTIKISCFKRKAFINDFMSIFKYIFISVAYRV